MTEDSFLGEELTLTLHCNEERPLISRRQEDLRSTIHPSPDLTSLEFYLPVEFGRGNLWGARNLPSLSASPLATTDSRDHSKKQLQMCSKAWLQGGCTS